MPKEKGKGKWVEINIPGREGRVWIPERHVMSWKEAKSLPDAYVIMEGDFGGQCYLTAPVRIIRCQESGLRELMRDIDRIFWNDEEGQRLYYERHSVGDYFDSGMGGAGFLNDVWIHKQIIVFGLATKIKSVVFNETPRIELSEEEFKRLKTRAWSTEERKKYADYLDQDPYNSKS